MGSGLEDAQKGLDEFPANLRPNVNNMAQVPVAPSFCANPRGYNRAAL
jgi:hypothetical protein